jgi:hypothetical protein
MTYVVQVRPVIFIVSWMQWYRSMSYLQSFNMSLLYILGVRRSVVGWGAMLLARSRDQFLMRWIFFNLSNPSSRLSLKRKWVPRIFLRVKGGRRVRLTTLLPSVSRLSRQNVGALMSHNPRGLHGLSLGKLYLFFFFLPPLHTDCTSELIHTTTWHPQCQ